VKIIDLISIVAEIIRLFNQIDDKIDKPNVEWTQSHIDTLAQGATLLASLAMSILSKLSDSSKAVLLDLLTRVVIATLKDNQEAEALFLSKLNEVTGFSFDSIEAFIKFFTGLDIISEPENTDSPTP